MALYVMLLIVSKICQWQKIHYRPKYSQIAYITYSKLGKIFKIGKVGW
jgi:hypothetical protein